MTNKMWVETPPAAPSQEVWQDWLTPTTTNQGEWIDWSSSAQPAANETTIHETFSKTFSALNGLSGYPAHHLFLGVNPKTGAPEMMAMDKPRSLMIKSCHFFGKSMLMTMAMAIKSRVNQKHMPITILSHDHTGWYRLSEHHKDVEVLSPDSCSREMRELLINNKSDRPHFLIIEDLYDLLGLDSNSKSVMRLLLSQGSIHNGVYVLACYEPTNNIKSNNEVGGWLDHDDILNAEATRGPKTLTLKDGTNIFVPERE